MIRRARPLLGTFVEIGVKLNPVSKIDKPAIINIETEVIAAINKAFNVIEGVQQCLSFQQRASELSQLNADPGCWVDMSRHSLRVLRLAKAMGKMSGERFNCTLGGAMVLAKVLPQLVEHDFVQCGSWQDIEIVGNKARLLKPILVTLDGIAKGYAVDLAINELIKTPVAGGWVNAGGDLKIFGSASLSLHQRHGARLSQPRVCQNIAIATSRYAEKNSQAFPAQLLDGRLHQSSAKLAPATAQSFSVAARYAWRADALTKVAATLPAAEREQMIIKLGGRCLQFSYDQIE